MELFLLCSDDAESDVRMVADECLNKVIKVRTLQMCVSVIVAGSENKLSMSILLL